MKTKAEIFWDKIDSLVHERGTSLKEFCRVHGITYGTVMSNKSRMIMPNIEIATRFASGLGVLLDRLLASDIILDEYEFDRIQSQIRDKEERIINDPLYDLLDDELDLKALVWRVVRCDAIQRRTIKQMLTSWGIEVFDSTGRQIEQTV